MILLLAVSCGRSSLPPVRSDAGTDDADAVGSPADARSDLNSPPGDTGDAGDARPPNAGDARDGQTTDADANDGAADRTGDTRPPDALPDALPDLRTPTDASCPVNCNQLPHIRPDVTVPCIAGVCSVTAATCVDGFGHCTSNPNDGCETDLTGPQNCGGCFRACNGSLSACRATNGFYSCVQNCVAPTPDLCGYYCTDLQTDQANCGTCGSYCYLPNAGATCVQGQCTMTACTDDTVWADCTAEPGCETMLGTPDNCGSCGDQACALANTLFTCSNGVACQAAVCAPGYGNCDATSADCETTFASPAGATCLPAYVATSPIATQVFGPAPTAIAADGSFFLAGVFLNTVDFDPTTARDVRTAADNADAYVTKFNPDGSYGWTRVFAGRGDMGLTGIAAAADGSLLVTGWYVDALDLDPGPTSDLRITQTAAQSDPYVVKLAADGSYIWGRTFAGSDGASGSASSIALDAAGAVYVAGWYSGTMDFDPGPATDLHTAPQPTGMIVKLTATGDFVWSQSFADGNCALQLNALTVASDGSVWGTGIFAASPECPLGPARTGYINNDIVIVKVGATGAALATWTLGSSADDAGNAIVAGRDGSVLIGGSTLGTIDFDPGPGVANRGIGGYGFNNGFVLDLDATGAFRWVRIVDKITVASLAATADGGALAVGIGPGAFVTRLGSDGASAWTFIAGDQTGAKSVAVGTGQFVIGGSSSGSADFDPGPDIDPVYGDITFVSRFHF